MVNWRRWVGPICTAAYLLFVVVVVPYVIFESVKDDFKKKDQLILIGGLFVLVSLPISVWRIYQHLIHLNRPNLQKPIIRILLMVPIYAMNAWLALVFPRFTIYMDSIREWYEAYVIYNFMMYLLNALNMEMDLHAVMREKPQVRHVFPLCYMRSWDMDNEFLYKCKHGILQYVFVQPIVTVISVICELCGVYGKGTIAFNIAYPYLSVVTNISQFVAMYCLVLFYRANKEELSHMRPFPKFACIKAVIFFSYIQGVTINCLVYFKVIKDIFDTSAEDDYQILSEILQNFLLCIEMFLAAVAHHYSYPVHEHQINLPNHQVHHNPRDLLSNMLDMNDILQDGREHLSSVWNSIKKPFRAPDPFEETKSLMATNKGNLRHSSTSFNTTTSSGASGSQVAAGANSRYGTVDYVKSTVCVAPQPTAPSCNYHQGAPPQPGNMFFGNKVKTKDASESGSRLDSPSTSSSSLTTTQAQCKKSESNNTNSWLTNSTSDDAFNIEVRGLEEDLIQLKNTPPL